MSKASEWARMAIQAQAAQPKFECVTVDEWDEDKDDTKLKTVAALQPTMRLRVTGCELQPADARAFARWILDTFGESATASGASQPEGLRP